jgi:hypothetical protein
MQEIQKALRNQHRDQAGPHVHPATGFLVPEWNGHVAFSGAAILGNAPTWAL